MTIAALIFESKFLKYLIPNHWIKCVLTPISSMSAAYSPALKLYCMRLWKSKSMTERNYFKYGRKSRHVKSTDILPNDCNFISSVFIDLMEEFQEWLPESIREDIVPHWPPNLH